MSYRVYISNGGKSHCYYELRSLLEANAKMKQLIKRKPNLTYTIEGV